MASSPWVGLGTSVLWLGLEAAFGLLLVYAAARVARSRPGLFAACFGFVIVQSGKNAVPSLNVGGLAVVPLHAVILVSLVSATWGLPQLRANLGRWRWLFIAMAAAVVIQTVLGFVVNGTAAFLDSTNHWALLCIGAYILSLDPQVAKRIVRNLLIWTGVALIYVGLDSIAHNGIGNANTQIMAPDGSLVTNRPLVASHAVLLSAAAMTTFHEWSQGRGTRYAFLTAAFLSMVVVVQHRSVWAATTVGFILLITRIKFSRILTAMAVVLWVGMIAGPILYISPIGSEIGPTLFTSATTASLTTGSGGDRTASSGILIQRQFNAGLGTVIFGTPFGSGYDRVVRGRAENYQPHNAYVSTFIRLGLIGLVMVLGILALAWRRSAPLNSSNRVTGGWIILFGVFSTAYGFPWQLSPLIAVALIPLTTSGTGSSEAGMQRDHNLEDEELNNMPAGEAPRKVASFVELGESRHAADARRSFA